MAVNKLGDVIIKRHKSGFYLFEQEGARQVERKQCNSESAEQKTLWAWLEYEYPQVAELTFHVPNEISANAFYGAQQAQIGKKGGVSDLVSLYSGARWHAGCFELKRVNPALYRPSRTQREFLGAAHEQGKFACCCWGAEAMKRAFMFYLTGE